MAEVKPFCAVRYGERAGPLEALVAPPYDVISPEQRDELRARSPYNVVHLTLPDDEHEAGRLWSDWRAEGILPEDDEAGFWWLSQDYVGPDGVARTREGLVAALRIEPYENRVILPHERTHRGPKEGRLRLLRETRAQLEPLFFLYEGGPPAQRPERDPDLEADGASLWRLPADAAIAEAFAERQLLIADGHHRYETAVAYHEEEGGPESAYVLAVLVSLEDPGLMIFPTHRLLRQFKTGIGFERRVSVESALAELDDLPHDRAAFVVYEPDVAAIAFDGDGLDVEFFERVFGHDDVDYTPDWREAVRRVDAGEAAVAYLMRPTRIEDVFAVAQRGETMPQKSTYFYPKLVSGLLFLPL